MTQAMKRKPSPLELELGFQPMFHCPETCMEAETRVTTLANTSNDPAAVVTAVMMYQNQLIRQIVDSYELIPKPDALTKTVESPTIGGEVVDA